MDLIKRRDELTINHGRSTTATEGETSSIYRRRAPKVTEPMISDGTIVLGKVHESVSSG